MFKHSILNFLGKARRQKMGYIIVRPAASVFTHVVQERLPSNPRRQRRRVGPEPTPSIGRCQAGVAASAAGGGRGAAHVRSTWNSGESACDVVTDHMIMQVSVEEGHERGLLGI